MAYEKKLIEGNFPCQQVGAETKRERGASSSLPPLYFLHVWWARRPLTPSRAAVLGSILPADVAPDVFLKELGIVKKQAIIGTSRWTLVGKNLELIETDDDGDYIPYTEKFTKAFDKENLRRSAVREKLDSLCLADPSLNVNDVFTQWYNDNLALPLLPFGINSVRVETVPANPAAINERIAFRDSLSYNGVPFDSLSIDSEDMYGYGRAYETPLDGAFGNITVLDPTAGGGSIPFEAMRLGCRVIANDLNPVASAIELATLVYPVKYGSELIEKLNCYGEKLVDSASKKMEVFFPSKEGEEIVDYLFYREVTCPHCGERAPLLNAYALSKKKDGWMVLPKIEGLPGSKKVRFIPTRLVNGKGPHGEDPEAGTVYHGTGTCIHCGQAIESEEIKRQARGESSYGAWSDRLYCIVGLREQPKLGKDGKPMTYSSGPDKGMARKEKVSFFREPTEEDLEALAKAEQELCNNWTRWEAVDLIPTEKIPEGHKTAEPLRLGIERWCDMFTPRQLLGHLTAMETLQDLTPSIIEAEGAEKGKAIIHYLQYMIDKCLGKR